MGSFISVLWFEGSVVAAWRLSWSVACGILVPWPGIKPESPALPGRFLTTVPTREVPRGKFLDEECVAQEVRGWLRCPVCWWSSDRQHTLSISSFWGQESQGDLAGCLWLGVCHRLQSPPGSIGVDPLQALSHGGTSPHGFSRASHSLKPVCKPVTPCDVYYRLFLDEHRWVQPNSGWWEAAGELTQELGSLGPSY